ncbi:DUF6263 family protein [Parapedobacter deserti]|uniref:DUF6263 family protein n=1 Tax=Parapedobacter deserti TaxID=1912957 RepID=A0ABV7JL74_9SPHI
MKRTAAFGLLSVLLFGYGNLLAHGLERPEKSLLPKKRELVLRLNFQQGDKYLFSTAIKQNIEQEMMGQKMIITQDVATDYIYDVQSVQNGFTTIQVTIDGLKMDTDMGGIQRLRYDSDDPESGTSDLQVMTNMIGKSFIVHINGEGSVKKVEGIAELIGFVDGAQAELLKQVFGDSTMIQTLNQITDIYPNRKVAIGDTWTKTFSGPIAGFMQSTAASNFSLSEISGDMATLDFDGQMSFSKLPGGGSNPMLQGAEINLSGTQKGTLEVDTRSGMPLKTTMKQDVSGNIEVQGLQIPMTIVSDITVTGKKL